MMPKFASARFIGRLAGASVAVLTVSLTALAQQPPSVQGSNLPPPTKAANAKAAAAKAAGGDAQPKSGDPLRSRIEQLEEQLTDMQVAIGTLESLGRGGGGASGSAPRPMSGGGDSARLDGIEQQVRTLNSKLDQLSERIRALEGGTTGARAGMAMSDPGRPPEPTSPPPLQRPEPRVSSSGFGSVTVAPEGGQRDDIGRLINRDQPGGEVSRSDLPTAGDGGSKQLYEQAYGYMLQQDYPSAESAFADFLDRYPNDALAGNAQYWLGETFFVRGQFRPAASAFLKGYQTYSRSQKAPDSLLKLALSLQRLGQKDAACSSLNELNTKFPAAPTHVKSRAAAERQKAAC